MYMYIDIVNLKKRNVAVLSVMMYCFVAGTPPPAYQPHDENPNMGPPNNPSRNTHPRNHQPMDTMPSQTTGPGGRIAGK